MDPTSQKLVHSFGALADLGQEIANTREFNEMVRTSLHLLLGTLAIRRGVVAQCQPDKDEVECLAVWGLGDDFQQSLRISATAVSYTHLRAHETPEHLVCRLLLEKK